jgi:hypothetical protein
MATLETNKDSMVANFETEGFKANAATIARLERSLSPWWVN